LEFSPHIGLPKGWIHDKSYLAQYPLKKGKWEYHAVGWFYGPAKTISKAYDFLKKKYGEYVDKNIIGNFKAGMIAGKDFKYYPGKKEKIDNFLKNSFSSTGGSPISPKKSSSPKRKKSLKRNSRKRSRKN
jgi:hypothetical protein